ncbi:MAG: hypothetical protein OQJ97_08405 [Rhodospirillales bacterium]|nr:hypothetical protein [Rhodospirillales bacterium]
MSGVVGATAATLNLIAGTTISDAQATTVTNLSVSAGGQVALDVATNDIGTLAVNTTTGNVTVTDTNALTVGTVNGINGINTNAGAVSLSAGGALTVSNTAAANDVAATTGVTLAGGANAMVRVAATADVETSGGNVVLRGDDMDIAGTVTNTGRQVTLRSVTNGDAIDLGDATDATADTLELSNAELGRVATGTVVVGAANAGAVNVTAALNSPASTLNVTTGSTVTTGATIDGNFNLTIAAADDVTFNANVGGTTALNTFDITGKNITSSAPTMVNAATLNLRGNGGGTPLVKVVLNGTLAGFTGAAAAQRATSFGPYGPGPFTFNGAFITGAPTPGVAGGGRKRLPRAQSVVGAALKLGDNTDRGVIGALFPRIPNGPGSNVVNPRDALNQNGERDRFLIDPYKQEYRLIRMNQQISNSLGGRNIIVDSPLWQQFVPTNEGVTGTN